MDARPYFMRPWDEVLGPALSVEEIEGNCLALIGKILVYLPIEMAPKIRASKGQRIGILRTDRDYRFRICDQRRS